MTPALLRLLPCLLLLAACQPPQAALQPPARLGFRLDDAGLARFSWQLADARRGARQSAFQLRAARSAAQLEAGRPDWDSGKQSGERSVELGFQIPLDTPFFWQVAIWDAEGQSSGFSPPQPSRTGLPAASGAFSCGDPALQRLHEAIARRLRQPGACPGGAPSPLLAGELAAYLGLPPAPAPCATPGLALTRYAFSAREDLLRREDSLARQALAQPALSCWPPAWQSPLLREAGRYASLSAAASLALALGQQDSAARRLGEALALREAFPRPSEGYYAERSLAENLVPLAFGMARDEEAPRVLRHLTGLLLEPEAAARLSPEERAYLLPLLSEYGQQELAWRLAAQASPGSDACASDQALACGSWLYRHLVGIRPDPAAPGFLQAILKPSPLPGIGFAEAQLPSPAGDWRIRWEFQPGKLLLEVDIPANAMAQLFFPVEDPLRATVYESGQPWLQGGKETGSVEGMGEAYLDEGQLTAVLTAGKYRFEIR
jgi:hypothetical protein